MIKDTEGLNRLALHVGKGAIAAILYIVVSLLGILFIYDGNNLPLIWPQYGVGVALTLLFGYTILPGIFFGDLFSTLFSNTGFLQALISSIGTTTSIFFCAYILLNQKSFSKKLNNYQSVFTLLAIGAIFGPFISASINAIGIFLLRILPAEFLPVIWQGRFLRSALGTLIFTPVIIIWLGNPLPRVSSRRVFEAVITFILIAIIGLFIFLGDFSTILIYPFSFLIIPLIIWSTIRNDIHGSSIINFLAACLFLWGIADHQSMLINGNISSSISFLCIICTMQVTTLIISASMSELSATQESLSYLSTHDALTGLYNRLFFETEFKRLEKSRQYPISIIMADIDGLKMVNDTFGHKTGDQILNNVAKLFSDVFRAEDIVSRYGGDEFTILLPETKAEITQKIIDRIQHQIKLYNQEHTDLPLYISMGSSTANQGESLRGHLKRADERMYKEKEKNKRKAIPKPD